MSRATASRPVKTTLAPTLQPFRPRASDPLAVFEARPSRSVLFVMSFVVSHVYDALAVTRPRVAPAPASTPPVRARSTLSYVKSRMPLLSPVWSASMKLRRLLAKPRT